MSFCLPNCLIQSFVIIFSALESKSSDWEVFKNLSFHLSCKDLQPSSSIHCRFKGMDGDHICIQVLPQAVHFVLQALSPPLPPAPFFPVDALWYYEKLGLP